jgi:putative flippase GtrA
MRGLVTRYRRSGFARFLVLGSVNTAVTYGLYLALLPLLPYQAGYTVAYLAGIILAYVFNRNLVFLGHRGLRSVVLFPLVYLAQYLVSLLILWLWIDKGGLNASLGPLIVIAITVPMTYLLSREVFSESAR